MSLRFNIPTDAKFPSAFLVIGKAFGAGRSIRIGSIRIRSITVRSIIIAVASYNLGTIWRILIRFVEIKFTHFGLNFE
jgi:hypothetical protein